jgi:hypothetical protein
LSEANLQGASLSQTQLSQAKTLSGATLPDGSKHPLDSPAADKPGSKRKPDVNRLAEAAARLRKKPK